MCSEPTTVRTAAAIIGTRPEALKLASVLRAAWRHPALTLRAINSGQHPHMVRDTLAHLGLQADIELPAIPPQSSLSRSVAHLRASIRDHLRLTQPDVVLVQGDTSTAYAGALAASDLGLAVAHLEAGLRTANPMRPFPEEPFRRRIALLSTWHLAPTIRAAKQLLDEGIAETSVHIVGNSVVDILRDTISESPATELAWQTRGQRLLVLTLHRRENYQHGLVQVCTAILDLLERHDDLCVVCPVHPNPTVGARIRRLLGAHPRILLTEPLPYRRFVALLKEASVVVTDSGGIQEEAVYLGLPVLVARQETERPEAQQAGFVELVGTEPDRIVRAVQRWLFAPRPAPCGFHANAPFGDGHTAQRVLHILTQAKPA